MNSCYGMNDWWKGRKTLIFYRKKMRMRFHFCKVFAIAGNRMVFVKMWFANHSRWLPIKLHCEKSARIRSFYGSYLLRISPYSVRMWENTDQKNSKYGHIDAFESLSNLVSDNCHISLFIRSTSNQRSSKAFFHVLI